MLSLISRQSSRVAPLPSPSSTVRTRTPSRHAPRMRSVLRPAPSPWTPHASYYFDAVWHTAQTLRHLLKASLAKETLGLRPTPELLAFSTAAMLDSIRPGFPDDTDSLACFHRLLQMHLSGLSADELRQLAQHLNAQRFDHVVIESVIDDVMVAEHGFANGPPHCRQRTLMFAKDFQHALYQATQTACDDDAALTSGRRLTSVQAQQARDVLASLAERHAHGGITLTGLVCAVQQLALASGTPLQTDMAVAAHPMPPASSVSWQDRQLVVELRTLTTLIETRDRQLHASLLRDLLELVLAHKLFEPPLDLMTLPEGERLRLQREVEQVLSRAPSVTDDSLPARAARVLARHAGFGTMQILPTVGAMLGHAWIAPVLSVVPDRSRKGVEAGRRFMRSGLRTEPAQCTVNEWDIRWLSARENDELYPAEHAWHLTVPAHWLKLQQAATDIREEWQRKKLPYRFIGTAPGMVPTGCRATVWQAVQRAMDEDTRSLFELFARGLPEPDSPTELALRMRQFMDWLHALARRSVGERGDL